MAFNLIPNEELNRRALGTSATRDLQLGSGDTNAALDLGRRQTSPDPSATPNYGQFGLLLTQLLQRYQGLGTAQFQRQGLNAQEEQARRMSAETPTELIGASPSVQAGARNAAAGAVEPTISGAEKNAQTFKEQISSLGGALEAAQAFATKQEQSDRQKQEDARAVVEFALGKGGSSGLESLIMSNPEILKSAGMDSKTLTALLPSIKAKEAEERAQFNTRYGSSGGSSGDQLYSGLSPATATAVRGRVSRFSTEPLIQNFATVQEGRNFAKSLSDATTNPADDQALIYALAKALDPGSVVREGEYATAQKYSQSWVKAYGKGVTQAILGTGFLSQEARNNIKKTIEQKYAASKTSYDNLYKQYTSGINSLTGRGDGASFLTDYVVQSADDLAPPGGGGQGTITENDIRETIQAHQSEYPTREALIEAIASTGADKNTVTNLVYTLIPDKTSGESIFKTTTKAPTTDTPGINRLFGR